MHIISLALGGCIKGAPVEYGLTEDTGGHINYILGEMAALAAHPAVDKAEIVTRLFDDPTLGKEYAVPSEKLPCGTTITRIDSGNRRYLAKEALALDRGAFVEAFIKNLRDRPRLPDLIHAHFADAADVARQVRKRLGIPFIYTAHSLGIDKLDAMESIDAGKLRDRIREETRAVEGSDAIVASSRDECERQLPLYAGCDPAKVHRLRPGVTICETRPDLDPAKELIAPFLRNPDKPIVLAIARPVKKKNLAALVDAFGHNQYLRSEANLVILAGLRRGISDGEKEQRAVIADLLDAIDRHELYGKVAYPPRHSQDQVRSLYALASETRGVFVNPAHTEPYGLTLVEAAAHGLPVAATRHGGPNDIVAELENGQLIDPGDTVAIGRTIAEMLQNRDAWNTASQNGRINSRDMSWRAYATGFIALAREIIAPPKAAAPLERSGELLVCDIDNTLTGCLDSARRFSSYVDRREDVSFCVATGRSLIEARRILREWQLPLPDVLITSVGSEIYLRTPGGLRLDQGYANRIGKDWHPVEIEQLLRGMPGLSMQTCVEQRRWKRSYFFEDRDVEHRVQERLDRAGMAAKVIASHGRMLDVLPSGAGKGAAMMHVAAKAGIAPENIVAVGDSGNDFDMLRECRNAIIVGNHDADLEPLVAAPNVYVARRSHAGGVIEGHLLHMRRRKKALVAQRSAA